VSASCSRALRRCSVRFTRNAMSRVVCRAAHQRGMLGQPFRLPAASAKTVASHPARQDIATHDAQCSGVDEVYMPPGQFREGGLGLLNGVAAQQFSVFSHRIS